MTCDRCGQDTFSQITSRFNLENLCPTCHDDEQEAPGYTAAAEAELSALKRGDYNFRGIGLSAADLAFLAERRKARTE